MSVLQLRDPHVKAALRHPALAGLKRMARGSFCAVYDKGDTVLKLTCDAKQYCLYTDYCGPKGAYFPTLVKNYSEVGETSTGLTLYLVEMEKLQPVNTGSIELRRLARNLIWRTYDFYGSDLSPQARVGAIAADENFPQDLRDALGDLETFFSNYEDCAIDFHNKNLMRRGEQLVLNDVVADKKTLDSYRQSLRRDFH